MDVPRLFRWQLLLCPLAIAWIRFEVGISSSEWKALYVFGFRLAIWRCD